MSDSAKRARGLTLIELMVVIAVIAILIAIATPNISEIIKNNRATSQANELAALINLGRNEAVRRHLDIGQACGFVELELTSTANGWLGELTAPTLISGVCGRALVRETRESLVQLTIEEEDTPLRFDSRGYLAQQDGWNAVGIQIALQHNDCSGDRQRRELRVLPSGSLENQPAACQ